MGVSQRFQTCNIHACLDLRDFRQELCERNPPHSRYTEWEAPSLGEWATQALGSSNDMRELSTMVACHTDATVVEMQFFELVHRDHSRYIIYVRFQDERRVCVAI